MACSYGSACRSYVYAQASQDVELVGAAGAPSPCPRCILPSIYGCNQGMCDPCLHPDYGFSSARRACQCAGSNCPLNAGASSSTTSPGCSASPHSEQTSTPC